MFVLKSYTRSNEAFSGGESLFETNLSTFFRELSECTNYLLVFNVQKGPKIVFVARVSSGGMGETIT
jgi:hypothetical protein